MCSCSHFWEYYDWNFIILFLEYSDWNVWNERHMQIVISEKCQPAQSFQIPLILDSREFILWLVSLKWIDAS